MAGRRPRAHAGARSLTSTDSNTGFPTCYQPGGWGTNTVAWGTSTSVPPGSPTGSQSQVLTVTNYSSGDAKLLPTLDLGQCTPTVVPGNSYTVSVQYESTGTTQFALYYRTTSDSWVYWTSSPFFATASTWTTASFTTPAVPAGANGVSFGLALIANGTLTTDDYSFVLPASGGSGAARAAAVAGPVTSIQNQRTRWHSHLRLRIPGRGTINSGQRFALPEWPGLHAKSRT